MPRVADAGSFMPIATPSPRRIGVWMQRISIAGALLLAMTASVISIHAAGPNAQAMLAGEGMLINPIDSPR